MNAGSWGSISLGSTANSISAPYAASMARTIATNTTVDLDTLLDFVRPRHDVVLITRRADGGLQTSPVTAGVDDAGRVVISSYPERAKVANIRRDPRVTLTVLGDDFGGAWVQVDGEAEVLDLPE